MTNTPILELARNVDPEITEERIIPLNGGFSSQAFKLMHADNPSVLLVHRSGGVKTPQYGHAFAVLKLLEQHGFAHAPRALWLSEDQNAIAVQFFDGAASNEFDFESHSMDPRQVSFDLIDALLETERIPLANYTAIAQSLNVELRPIERAIDAATAYGTQWFEIVREWCPNPDLIAWLEPRIQRSFERAQSMPDSKPILYHGDPSNPNILIRNDGEFLLIDWDSARFMCSGPEYLVAYTTHLTDFMKPFRKDLIEHVSKKLGISEQEFTLRVHEHRKFAEVFDVNWAAMMMGKVARGETQGDVEHFRKIAYERMQMYNESFGNTVS